MSTARSSESVFGSIEPKNTKAIFGRVQQFVLDTFTATRESVRFVEIGANDGQRADPIHAYVMAGKWKGLLVEPLPGAFEALKATYAGVPGLTFRRLAISDRTGDLPFFAVEGQGDVMSSFSRETVMKHAASRPGLEDLIVEIAVPTCTFEQLLDEAGMDAIDVVAVDTEGHDDTVLATLDIEKRAPSLILFEHVLLSAAGSATLKARLESLPYTLIWDRHDVIAIRDGVLPPDMTRFLREVVEAAKTR